MRFLFTMQLGAVVACWFGLLGCGQDDPKHEPDWSEVAKPGGGNVPFEECVPPEVSSLGLSEPTAFGASGVEMLAAVVPADSMIPFFWVAYDDLDAPVRYFPGVSETLLRLSIGPHEGAVVQQSITPPTESPCEPSHIEIPVRVAVETIDGALAETFDADVSFQQRDVASLSVELAPDAIRGGLALEPTGALAAGWQFRKLGIHMSLWRGGTSGAIAPAFVKSAPTPETAVPPLRTGQQASARARAWATAPASRCTGARLPCGRAANAAPRGPPSASMSVRLDGRRETPWRRSPKTPDSRS